MDFDAPILTDFDDEPSHPGDSPDPAQALLADLTEPQKQAVLHTEGPLLVLAAAGSGKTRVITRRIAYLVHCGVPAWQILALTFTNKAAGEMRERIGSLLGEGARASRGLTVSTFHALCARLLRRYAEAAGLKPEFAIFDTGDQLALVKKAVEACQLSTANFQPRALLSAISNAKNDLLDAEQFAAGAMDFSSKCVAQVYRVYTRMLRQANGVDFDDLLLLTARALAHNAQVREECRARWQYLLIDEYQDTNKAQFQIASLIAGEGQAGSRRPNICVVGDPDQAIYGWRGADISNILDFEEHYPAAAVIKLGENFRSTAPILAAADTLIKRNTRRKHKPLFTSKSGGDRVEGVLCRDEHHEARLVAEWLRARHAGDEKDGGQGEAGTAWREMAVFYRTNALSRVMEDALREANIPYTIARGTAFYDREEIKHALAYLRVVANPADGVSLSRIVNVPTRAIGDTTYARLESHAAAQGVTVFEAMRRAGGAADLAARAQGAVSKFVQMMDGWTAGGAFMGQSLSTSLADLVDRVVKESGLESMYKAQAHTSKSDADAERVENLAELVSSARQFEMEYDPAADPAADPNGEGTPPLLAMLRGYLESVALVADADAVDPAQGSVTLMTLHAAKGLEFGAVAMIGLEEGLLPHARARENDAAMEEERRLCFVGITRAMRRLLMTASKYRTIRGMSERTIPSRFLGELPSEHVVMSDQSDVWGGQDDDATDESPADTTRERRAALGGSGRPGAHPYPVGSVVRHPQFGVGVVQSATLGADARVVVAFRGVGTKTLVVAYARLTLVNPA
jgi:DNA helicase-2/ATP-dependent DNA helicase PcrA